MDFKHPALLHRLIDDDRGATAIEYSLLAAMCAIVIIGSLVSFGDAVTAKFDYIAERVAAAMAS